MPKVLEIEGFKFFFYSNENNEPIHIHISRSKDQGEAEAKYWLFPTLEEVYCYGFKVKERKRIKILVEENAGTIINKWNEFFQ